MNIFKVEIKRCFLNDFCDNGILNLYWSVVICDLGNLFQIEFGPQ